jgi:N-formylglutamate deformylase
MQVFTLRAPEADETPVVVEVPHAGWGVPEDVADDVVVPHRTLVEDSDIYVDKLCEQAPSVGATYLAARVSRYVVDLNRGPHDVDRQTVPDHPQPQGLQPRGVVWRLTARGRPALRRPLRYRELEARLAAYYTPYHQALREILDAKRTRFGYAVLLACHSMPSASRNRGGSRADIVPGSRGRTSADAQVIDAVDRYFRQRGYDVRHDDPYRGGYTTQHYGRPQENVHAIQLELNRALYVDEATSEPKDGAFEALQRVITGLVEELGRLHLTPAR